ncbi:uncharacterized protein J3D65DRAFT_316895 [Phyllosticta citribraziliensis]|uniref:F-box domain-containing protein n=1 Tax=Phyllosticta citribraziliensis TaxID=989973 RepID=A0ABR1LSJ1_9PEZI
MASLQRRRSVEPGTAFQVGCAKAAAAAAPPSPSNASVSVDSPASPAQLQPDPFSSLKSDYVVPPMSSVSVDPPIPAETDSRSAQDQHPMRANLPLLSQPLLSTDGRPSGPAGFLHHQTAGHATAPIPLSTTTTCPSSSPNNHLVAHLNPNQPGPGPHARHPHSRPHHQNESRSTATVATSPGGPTLLTLPPEIRRLIYQHIPHLTNSQPLIYCLSLFRNRRQHPLAGICRLMRAEALEMYYSSNTWLVKLEYRDFYDSFKSWVASLDAPCANALRQLRVSVRGVAFARGMRWDVSHALGSNGAAGYGVLPDIIPMPPQQQAGQHQYHLLPSERASAAGAAYGYATFGVDLSERWANGRVEVLACDGSKYAGLEAKMVLEGIVKGLWEKRRRGEMRGVDLNEAMDRFLDFTGWWL